MIRQPIGQRQIRWEEQFKAVVTLLNLLTEQGKEAAENRRRDYEAAEATRLEPSNIVWTDWGDPSTRPTTAEYAHMCDRMAFAGSLGRALWALGKLLPPAAAGAAAA